MRVHGTLGGQNVSFLIDSGAAVSVISYGISARAGVREDAPLTVGANGVPLDVLGTVNLLAVVGTISVKHSFVVARTLTVECLLGIDFLSRYGAIIDCAENKLTFSRRPQGTTQGDEKMGHGDNITLSVSVAQTTSPVTITGQGKVRELWWDGRKRRAIGTHKHSKGVVNGT